MVFDPFFYHFRPGGHVAALHVHREHHYFARIDIEQFFYSVSRSVVQRALRDAGILKAQSFSKWSCVRNPYGDPAYSLPYGFVQSPILSTLVIMSSAIGAFLRALDPQVTATVYMDDISLSSNNQGALGVAFTGLLEALETAHFRPNLAKTKAPTETIELFNCKLQQGLTAVRESRRDEFYDTPKSPASEAAFEQYCASVEEGNF